jgi:hypothetical protein
MQDIGPWFHLTQAHLKLHWQKHLPPVLVFFGVALAIGFLVMPLFFCTGLLGAIAGGVTGSEAATLAVTIAGFTVGFLLIVGLSLGLMPLYLGYLRFALKVHRGEPAGREDVLWGFRNLGKVIGLVVLQGALTVPAALCCYFPAFFVGTALFFSFMVLVDREVGPVECLTASWALVKPRFLEMLVVMFILVFAMMVLAYVPFIGSIAGILVFVAAMVVIYDDLVQREHLRG